MGGGFGLGLFGLDVGMVVSVVVVVDSEGVGVLVVDGGDGLLLEYVANGIGEVRVVGAEEGVGLVDSAVVIAL